MIFRTPELDHLSAINDSHFVSLSELKLQFEPLRQGSEHCLVCAPVGASWFDIFRF